MEIIVKSKELDDVLNCISKIIPAKSSMEILSGILIEGKDELNFISTDLENTIKVSLKCQFKKGSILIPGKQFISLIKQIPDEEIKIEEKENEVEISNENIKYRFITMNPDDFPRISKISSNVSFNIQGNILKESIDKIKFCVNPNEQKPYFRGGLLEIKENNLYFIGTDGRRLSLSKIELESSPSSQIKVLLSFKLLNILTELLNDEITEVSIGKNQITFKFSNVLLVSQLLAGVEDFPEYDVVIPDEKKCQTAIIDKERFLSCLKRISLFTNERYNKLKITLNKGEMFVSVASPEIGQGQEKFEIGYDGEEMHFAFFPEFLIDFLQKVNEEKMVLSFTDKKSPVLMRPQLNNNFLYVTMPLKIE